MVSLQVHQLDTTPAHFQLVCVLSLGPCWLLSVSNSLAAWDRSRISIILQIVMYIELVHSMVQGKVWWEKGARAGVECEPQPTHVLPLGKPGGGRAPPKEIKMIVKVSLRLVEAIKLHRTDTTLDLSQKAEKGMRYRCTGCVKSALKLCFGRPLVWAAAFADVLNWLVTWVR